MKKDLWKILIRYLILVLVAIPGFGYIYWLLSPLTVYPVAFLLNFLYNMQLMGNTILLNKIVLIEIIGACIAGSAYYFLLILNLSVPKTGWKKRIYMLLFAFGTFLIINILRIFILSVIYMSGSSLFDITHKVFWYLGSTLFVIMIWFIEVKIFKIKQIPFYSDIKTLYDKSIFRNRRSKSKKK